MAKGTLLHAMILTAPPPPADRNINVKHSLESLRMTPLPEGGDFHTLTPDGLLLSSVGSKVHAWHNGAWQSVVDLTHLGLTLFRLTTPSSRW